MVELEEEDVGKKVENEASTANETANPEFVPMATSWAKMAREAVGGEATTIDLHPEIKPSGKSQGFFAQVPWTLE